MSNPRDTQTLLTEKINPRTVDIDQASTPDIIRMICEEDSRIAGEVARQSHSIARAVDIIVERMQAGGRLIFVGAGTSGRLGVMEAAECPPTFGTPPGLIQGVIAGGREAVWRSIEGAEDSAEDSARELSHLALAEVDVVVAVAASATTPFAEGALKYAVTRGCARILVTCNPYESPIADVTISVVVGQEVILGSTRMKAGTATKMVLNMLTTAAMIRMGKTYGNLMVDVQPNSLKLRDRARRIVMHILGVGLGEAEKLLGESGWNIKAAVLMERKQLTLREAEELLAFHKGFLRDALG
ncbi:MAG: N-acetylmuramic acid 6-phosphate etherase [Deltaproteobacteria bacterium]